MDATQQVDSDLQITKLVFKNYILFTIEKSIHCYQRTVVLTTVGKNFLLSQYIAKWDG